MMNAFKSQLKVPVFLESGTGPTSGIVVAPEACSAEDARAELRRVLESTQFDTSERNRRFLEYVVEETLGGRAERIKAYNIATVVFGRDASFDPQIDPVVRMEARRLRRSLERFYLTEGRKSSTWIAMPKGGYVPEFRNGLAAKSDVNSLKRRVTGEVPSGPGSSILVSPFKTEDDHPAFPNYNGGFRDQLLIGLSRFPELCVFGPGAVTSHHSKRNQEPSPAGLRVDFVLSGRTAVLADVFRVKTTLADAETGKVVWGQSFEHELEPSGILSARDEIANCIVRTLAQPFGVIFAYNAGPDGEARDLSAYWCLTRFYQYRRLSRRDLFKTVRECLERMVIADPDHSEVYACLSQIYTDGHRFGFALGESSVGLRRQAAAFAQRAIDLAPNSSRGYHAQGLAHWFLHDVDSSLQALQAALKLNPNATEVMVDLGLHWSLLGEWDRGIPLLEEALARDPLQVGSGRVALSLYHFANGRFEHALAEAKRIGAQHVTHGFVCRAISLIRLGRREEATEAVARIRHINPNYGRGALLDVVGCNLDGHLAGEIEMGLRDAGLPMELTHHLDRCSGGSASKGDLGRGGLPAIGDHCPTSLTACGLSPDGDRQHPVRPSGLDLPFGRYGNLHFNT